MTYLKTFFTHLSPLSVFMRTFRMFIQVLVPQTWIMDSSTYSIPKYRSPNINGKQIQYFSNTVIVIADSGVNPGIPLFVL